MSDAPETNSLRRLLKLGTTAGKVGASVAGNRLAELTRDRDGRELRQSENLMKNALRVVETLGELKGAAMKVGQMLSLQEGLLPPEIEAIFRTLQKDSPQVPFEVMRYEIEGSLGRGVDEVFAELEAEPIASASIGQVHRGRLHDGRRVAVKVQYPLIQEVIKADLDNLRRAFKTLFGLFTDAPFDPFWDEVRDRLLEEIDYEHEAANVHRFAALHADVPDVVIPAVVADASSSRVLTMEYVFGYSADMACSADVEQSLRDRWGQTLFELLIRGLFEHRLLHADPNLANFAFKRDGRLVVYDFGCLKEVPELIARGYGGAALAAAEGRLDEAPLPLREIGFRTVDGEPLTPDLTRPYVELLAEILREDGSYVFGGDHELYRRMIDHGLDNWRQVRNIRVPEEILFVDRTLGGTLGNLRRLRAAGHWREIALPYVERATRLDRDDT